MITRDFLLSRPAFTASVPAPERVDEAGPMPTAYRIYWNAASSEHRVALSGLVQRN